MTCQREERNVKFMSSCMLYYPSKLIGPCAGVMLPWCSRPTTIHVAFDGSAFVCNILFVKARDGCSGNVLAEPCFVVLYVAARVMALVSSWTVSV